MVFHSCHCGGIPVNDLVVAEVTFVAGVAYWIMYLLLLVFLVVGDIPVVADVPDVAGVPVVAGVFLLLVF
jgi:hypothetical protein